MAVFIVSGQDNPLLITLMLVSGGVFIGSFLLGFLLALFITSSSGGAPPPRSRSRRKRKKQR
jgi:hypothetical protein